MPNPKPDILEVALILTEARELDINAPGDTSTPITDAARAELAERDAEREAMGEVEKSISYALRQTVDADPAKIPNVREELWVAINKIRAARNSAK